MQLARALRLFPTPSSTPLSLSGRGVGGEGCIAFVGAGGKTTVTFALARELQSSNENRKLVLSKVEASKIIITATSHLGAWQTSLADHHIVAETPEQICKFTDGVTLVTGSMVGDRATPVNPSVLLWLHDNAKERGIPLLIEADGSRQKPLKAPDAHEPPIPEFVDTVVVVAGLGGLGQPLSDEHVHRPQLFSTLGLLPLYEPVSPEALTRVLAHPEGGLKNIPPRARRIALLNQADTLDLQAVAGRMSQSLLTAYDSVIIASLKDSRVHSAHERVAGIILAAGESKRFGRPKQLLDWRGEPFVRAVTKTALEAGLSPVIVVTGSNAEAVENAVKDLEVTIVRNEEWQSGQASSIAAGVGALPQNIGAGIFLLADQPQVGTDVIRALIEAHAQNLSAILAPLVLEERRGNPVLFDRAAFPDLLTLKGDVGGRAIFDKHNVEYLPWHDDALLLDVDTPEDYERLVSPDSNVS